MVQDRRHALLQQLPLTVSPFLNLPTATTLPYTYKSLPFTVPASVLDPPDAADQPPTAQPQYVVSPATGHSAHPSSILASCEALVAHLDAQRTDAAAAVRSWEQGIRERELAEKRRVAPGWLDTEERLLVPERVGGKKEVGKRHAELGGAEVGEQGERTAEERAGEELDRAFGEMRMG